MQPPWHPDFKGLGITLEEFFSTHWRRRPLRVPGGAGVFLNPGCDAAEFERLATAARSSGTGVGRPGEVCFIERASAFDSRLAAVAAQWQGWFGASGAWFDAVRTYSASGIGCHFDHSDNFVLQQDGVKHWRLEAPDRLPDVALRRRMLGTGGGDGMEFSGDAMEFVLEPGDLLYIPLFWMHEGVSLDASLSLSLVIPAMSLHAATITVLGEALRRAERGHQPLPLLHAGLSPAQQQRVIAEVREWTHDFLGGVQDEAIRRGVDLLQVQLLTGTRPARRG